MKHNLKPYICVWALLFALFNVIAFVSVGWAGQEKYTVSFWVGYILIIAAFLVQLMVSISVFNSKNAKELFHNLPILKKSLSMLIVSFIFGGAFILLSPLAGWVVLTLYMIILVASTLSIVKTTIAVREVERIEEKVETQTFFIKSLIVDAESLMTRAKSEAVKAECKKVYEAVRYSDPMSHDALASVESEIAIKFAKLTEAVAEDNVQAVTDAARDVVILVGDRNKRCKLLK